LTTGEGIAHCNYFKIIYNALIHTKSAQEGKVYMKFEFQKFSREGGTQEVNLSPSAVETKGKVLSSRGFVCSLLRSS
jgi:hypothetical protein